MSSEESKNYFADDAARKATFPGETSGKDYWLRSPCVNGGRVGTVTSSGYSGNAATVTDKYIRPVMYLDLNADACAQRTEAEGSVTWEYDVENTAHTYAEPTYT